MMKREDIIRMAQESGIDLYPGWVIDGRGYVNLARFAELVEAAVTERLKKSTNQEYGCHCDLEPGMKPGGCVFDEGRPQDCSMTRLIARKEECKYWKPIESE